MARQYAVQRGRAGGAGICRARHLHRPEGRRRLVCKAQAALHRAADRRADGGGCLRELPLEVQSSVRHRGAGLLHGAPAQIARYHGRMAARVPLTVVLLLLAGACALPQPATTVGALPGVQTERFPNGDVYVGQMAGGMREGQGSYTWSDGRRYVGSFRAGVEEGQGSYTYPNGEKYEGQF